MTIITGAAPSANVEGFAGWGNYTFVDPSVAIQAGSMVTHLGVHAPVGGTHRLRLGRELGGGSYDCPAAARVDLAHTVVGYQDAALAAPYTVPAGTWRLVGSVLAGSTTRSVTGGACTPSIVGDGTVTIATGLPAVPPMRATTGEGGDPPPPPPPPPPAGLTVAVPGQSNIGNMLEQAGGILTARFQTVTGQPLGLLNLCHDGSPVDLWAPGTGFRAEVMAANASAIAWGQFEADASAPDKAISHAAKVRSIIEEWRGIHGQRPAFMFYPFDNTNSRPHWWDVARGLELLCDPRYGPPDCTLILNGQLRGTIDAGIHLDQQRLESWARSAADVFARRLFPAAEILRSA